MTKSDNRLHRKAPIWVRSAIWAVFVVLLLSGFHITDAGNFPDPALPADVAAAPAEVATEGVFAQATNSADAHMLRLRLANSDDPLRLLPAWRWRSGTSDLYATYGFTEGISQHPLNAVAGLFFALAALVWWVILGVLNLALSLNFFDDVRVQEAINSMVAALGSSLWASGLVFAVLAFGFILVITRAIKGQLSSVFTVVLGVLLPLAALVFITSQASDSGGSNPGRVVGSPVWIANTGLGLVDGTATAASVGLVAMSDAAESLAASGRSSAYANLTPSCVAYKNALYDTFRGTGTIGQGGGDALRNRGSLETVSQLWEQSVEANWRIAQFSNAQPGERIYCHRLEQTSGVAPAEQASVGIVAGYPSLEPGGTYNSGTLQRILDNSALDDDVPADKAATGEMFAPGKMALDSNGRGQEISGSSDEGPEWFPNAGWRRDPYSSTMQNLNRNMNEKAAAAATYMWAACYYDGGTDDFHQVGWRAQPSWNQAGELADRHCAEWWYLGVPPGAAPGNRGGNDGPDDSRLYLDWRNPPGVGAGMSADDANRDSLSDISQVVRAYRGDNVGGRILAGLTTFLSSLVIGYALGGIAIGLLLAKIGFVLMMILLPATLFMLAVPTGKGQGRNPVGKRMLKMTGAYMVANFFLTAVLTFLVALIVMINGLASALPFGGGNGLLNMVAPLAAILLLRKLAKSVGLGDMMKPGGAMKMSAAAAQGMGGGKGFKAGAEDYRNRGAAAKAARADRRAKRAQRNQDFAAGKTNGLSTGDKLRAWGVSRAKGAGDNALLGATGQGAAAWRDRLTGEGSALDRAKSMSGLANMAAKRFDKNNPEAAAAIRNWGNKITGLNPGRMDQARAREVLAARRQEEWAATNGLRGAERADALRKLGDARMENQAALDQAERDGSGNILRTSGGQTITGFSAVNSDGSLRSVSASEAGYNSITGEVNDGYTIRTQPKTVVTVDEQRQAQVQYAHKRGVDPQHVLPSEAGLATIVMPTSTAGKIQVLPEMSSTSDYIEEAASGAAFLPKDALDRVSKLPSEARPTAIHQMLYSAGYVDPETGARLNHFEKHGITVDDRLHEEAAKNMAGKASLFDSIPRVPVTSAMVTSSIASAMETHRRVQGSIESNEGAYQELKAIGGDIRTHKVTRQIDEIQEITRTLKAVPLASATFERASREIENITVQVDEIGRQEVDLRVAATSGDTAAINELNRLAVVRGQKEALLNHHVVERDTAFTKVTAAQSLLSDPVVVTKVQEVYSEIGLAVAAEELGQQILGGTIDASAFSADDVANYAAARAQEWEDKITELMAKGEMTEDQLAELLDDVVRKVKDNAKSPADLLTPQSSRKKKSAAEMLFGS